MNFPISITLRTPASGWQVAFAPMELSPRVNVNAAKRHFFPAQGCFPMTD